MKIKYEFLTGEIVEVEVSNDFGEVSIGLGRDIYNNDRRETSKHNSVEDMKARGNQLADANSDILSIIERQEMNQTLHHALDNLLPQQRELILKVFIEGRSKTDIGREEGVDESAIRDRLRRIYRKLKKYL